MTVRRFAISIGLAIAGVGIVGCSNAVSGTPAASPAVGGGGDNYGTSFNSCSDLTDGDIVSYGLDPSTKVEDTPKIQGLGQGCAWTNDDIQVFFTVSRRTVADFQADKQFQSVTPISVGGRNSVKIVIDDTGNCGIAIPTGSSAVIIGLSIKFDSLKTAGDPCMLATNIANKFVSKLPK